jgi:hypothetical protein
LNSWGGYLVVAFLGGLVGATELANRYRDDPLHSVLTPAAAIYIIVNAGASASALYIVRAFGWDFGNTGESRDLMQILVAGLGSIALFRTKLFSAAYRGETYAWGPSRLLEQLLSISDRQVDRRQAKERSATVSEVMAGVSFKMAIAVLPAHALGLLENATVEDQKRLADDIKSLREDTFMDDASKAQLLGMAIIRLTGPILLRQAVNALGDSIKG